ncbi:MAG: bifunctional pyr operon transcriptional regulator/uracil phosphoribosyltransferase PyrR [Planctomycetes bacterium]|nr:bifunctional pyr operon transcriptional regulator/uracil phosphoribosyltransferase PyrR [Planctomycetota bacterium]
MGEKTLYAAAEIAAAIQRLATEIARLGEAPVLVGIHTGGVPLAGRLAAALRAATGKEIPQGTLDITLYRDDLAGRALPEVRGSNIDCDLEGRRVVLVDDVLFTGRTVRAALNELADYGRPSRVQLCVLVDRGHRELPICADYAGFRVETRKQDRVRVRLTETGAARDEVVLVQE